MNRAMLCVAMLVMADAVLAVSGRSICISAAVITGGNGFRWS